MADNIVLTKNNKSLVLNINRFTNYSKDAIKALLVGNGILTPTEAENFNFVFNNLSGTFSSDTYDLNFDNITVGELVIPMSSKITSIKRLNITGTKLTFNVKTLHHFSGDINIAGTGNEVVSIFGTDNTNTTHIVSAKGALNISNVKYIYLLQGTGGTAHAELYPDVLDIRNVDTRSCKSVKMLAYRTSPCDIIIGKYFSNENVDYTTDTQHMNMYSAPAFGRRLIIASTEVPVLKNCKLAYNANTGKYDIPVDEHDEQNANFTHWNSDWVSRGKFESILVPESAYNTYINNTYVNNGTVGKTGWSYYGPSGVNYGGKDIIETYEEGSYEPTEEWLYRKNS